MSDVPAITVQGVSKSFKLPHEKHNSIKSLVVNVFRHKRNYERQQVLKDISLEVKQGEFFGIVGRNGSGKSTLLKLLAGIYSPDQGAIHVNGKLTPFIELGVGFNPELTGRENVYLNGALLGFNRRDMNAMYEEIVDFAELGKFMDQKLKNYSSGMQVRLAFSIAIRAETDILVLDEVLAVGDEAFQRKCINIFEKYKAKKQTIVLVTHDMELIRNFCTKAVLIHEGELIKLGEPDSVAREYSKLNMGQTESDIKEHNQQIKSAAIRLKMKNKNDVTANSFETFEEMRVELTWPKDLAGVKNAGIAIHKNSGEYVFGDNTLDRKKRITGNRVDYSIPLDIGPGNYYLAAGLFGDEDKNIIDFLPRGPEFVVKSNPNHKKLGLVRLKSDWDY